MKKPSQRPHLFGNALIALAFYSSLVMAETARGGEAGLAQPAPVIISIDAARNYLVDGQPVDSLATLRARLQVEVAHTRKTKYYIWAGDDDHLVYVQPAILAVQEAQVSALGLIAEPLTSDPATAISNATLVTNAFDADFSVDPDGPHHDLLLDFDCSLYWNNDFLPDRAAFDEKLSAYSQQQSQPEMWVHLNFLAQWSCVVDLVTEIKQKGVRQLLLISSYPRLTPRIPEPEQKDFRMLDPGPETVLFSAIFGRLREPQVTVVGKWRMTDLKPLIVESK